MFDEDRSYKFKARYDQNGSGARVTDCCGAYSKYFEGALCCKVCFRPVPAGQGDGGERGDQWEMHAVHRGRRVMLVAYAADEEDALNLMRLYRRGCVGVYASKMKRDAYIVNHNQ